MLRLQHGHRVPVAFAGAALVAASALGALGAAPAWAETLGGEQLSTSAVTATLGTEAAPLPHVKAATWVLADAETGEILAHKGAHVRRAPASTLKMLTALTVMPKVPAETRYVATPKAAYTYGARVGLKVGKTYTVDQLWYAVFLPSANDAAIAVAEANGGVRKTVREMNDVAYELRALDTVARTPNGLDAPGQVSSAYDLALMARAGLERADFATYASTPRSTFPNVKGKGSHPIYTTNRLLLHAWPGAIGVKTGFTTQAGRTYVGAAKRHGRTLVVTLMGIRESSEWAAKKLLKWGFKNADAVTPVGQLVDPGSPLPASGPSASAAPASPPAQPVAAGTGSDDSSVSAAAAGPTPAGLPVLAIAGAVLLAAVLGGTFVAVRRR